MNEKPFKAINQIVLYVFALLYLPRTNFMLTILYQI